MTAETLRSLSREYAAGDIDRESYRKTRHHFLERVAAGEQAVERFVPPEPESPTVFPADDDGDKTQEIIQPAAGSSAASASTDGALKPMTLVIALIIGVGLAFAGLKWFGDKSKTPAPVSAVAEIERAPASDLFSEFLHVNHWTPQRLQQLTTSYAALGSGDQGSLQAGDSASRLRDAFVQQINAESALIDLDDSGRALETQDALLATAESIGLDGPRLREARKQLQKVIDSRAASEVAATAIAEATVPFEPTTPQSEADADADQQSEPNVGEQIDSAVALVAETPAAEAPVTPTPIPPATAAKQTDTSVAPVTPDKATAPTVAPTSKPAAATAKRSEVRSNCKAELAETRRPYCIDILSSGEKGPVLVVLPLGAFEMGGKKSGETPKHTVEMEQTIAMGLFEVSAKELQRFCSETDRPCPRQPWSDDSLPAVNVSWDLAREYARWLSGITHAEYRLPSEAEWEFAARGGTQTIYPYGDELLPTHAHFSFRNAMTKPLAANDRSVNRNDFRLYHMVGNVREWVLDSWTDNYRDAPTNGAARTSTDDSVKIVRGGSYADGSDALRSAARAPLDATNGDSFTGFRVVRVITN